MIIYMKILFTSDLHGDIEKYSRLLKIAHEYNVDAVINGGDMLPKTGDLFEQDKFLSDELDKHFSQFNDAGIYYLCCLGNDDLGIFDDLFDESCDKYPYVVNLAQRKFDIKGFEFIGMNWVVDYPFRLKDRCRMDTKDYMFQTQFGSGLLSTPNGMKELSDWFSYAQTLPTMEDELEQLIKPDNMSKTIYVLHMPPSHLGLDMCYNGMRVGSRAIYNFILENQPKLSLHGHIHESPEVSKKWYAELGNTICIQPGQLSPFTYVIVNLESMEFERIIDP
jgi:Icc-related predicted phosphoesterase